MSITKSYYGSDNIKKQEYGGKMKNNIWDSISLTLFYIFSPAKKKECIRSQNPNDPITETKVIFKHASHVLFGRLSCPYKTASLDGNLDPKISWENNHCFCFHNTLKGSKILMTVIWSPQGRWLLPEFRGKETSFEMWNVWPRSIELVNSDAFDYNEGFCKLASLLPWVTWKDDRWDHYPQPPFLRASMAKCCPGLSTVIFPQQLGEIFRAYFATQERVWSLLRKCAKWAPKLISIVNGEFGDRTQSSHSWTVPLP